MTTDEPIVGEHGPESVHVSTRWTEFVSLDDLRFADRNPKAHELARIQASISELGMIDAAAVLDERTGKMVGGHGRVTALRAMRAAGNPAPDGVLSLDGKVWMVPVLRGWSSKNDREAETAIIGLNQHTMAGGWDRELLDQMLLDLRANDITPDVLGFDDWPKHLDYADDDTGDGSSKLDDELVYKIVVVARDEDQQRELLERFAAEGLDVSAVFT